jgi:hypothetical protein
METVYLFSITTLDDSKASTRCASGGRTLQPLARLACCRGRVRHSAAPRYIMYDETLHVGVSPK